jgi:hypothetical protein
MYLPAFYKVKFEKYWFNVKRAMPFTIAPLILCNLLNNLVLWSFWPQVYNTIYTDFIPPPRGVQRRKLEH